MTLPPALQPTALHPFNRLDVPNLLAQRAVAWSAGGKVMAWACMFQTRPAR